jgi:hypothetical protein
MTSYDKVLLQLSKFPNLLPDRNLGGAKDVHPILILVAVELLYSDIKSSGLEPSSNKTSITYRKYRFYFNITTL